LPKGPGDTGFTFGWWDARIRQVLIEELPDCPPGQKSVVFRNQTDPLQLSLAIRISCQRLPLDAQHFYGTFVGLSTCSC
jgi:hypothetical protein